MKKYTNKFNLFLFQNPLAMMLIIVVYNILCSRCLAYCSIWDWNPGAMFLSEPEESRVTDKDEGVVRYPTCVEGLANLLVTKEVLDSSTESSSNDESSTLSSDSTESDVDPIEKYSARVIFNAYKMYLYDFRKTDIVKDSMEFMDTQFPRELLGRTQEELKEELCVVIRFQAHVANLEVSNVERDLLNKFRSAIITYNVALVTEVLNKPEQVRNLFNFTLTSFQEEVTPKI